MEEGTTTTRIPRVEGLIELYRYVFFFHSEMSRFPSSIMLVTWHDLDEDSSTLLIFFLYFSMINLGKPHR